MAWPWSAACGGSPPPAFFRTDPCRRRGSAADRSARCRMTRCPPRSRMYSPPLRSMARGIARSGRDCVMPGPALDATGAPADATEQLAGADTGWLAARSPQPRRHNHPRHGRRDVGHRSDDDDHPRGPRNHDGTIIPDTVDAMWGTDLTTTITGEGQAT